MQTRINRACRIGIVLWGSHFVEYISNIDGERIFCDCLSATNRQRRILIARSFSRRMFCPLNFLCIQEIERELCKLRDGIGLLAGLFG